MKKIILFCLMSLFLHAKTYIFDDGYSVYLFTDTKNSDYFLLSSFKKLKLDKTSIISRYAFRPTYFTNNDAVPESFFKMAIKNSKELPFDLSILKHKYFFCASKSEQACKDSLDWEIEHQAFDEALMFEYELSHELFTGYESTSSFYSTYYKDDLYNFCSFFVDAGTGTGNQAYGCEAFINEKKITDFIKDEKFDDFYDVVVKVLKEFDKEENLQLSKEFYQGLKTRENVNGFISLELISMQENGLVLYIPPYLICPNGAGISVFIHKNDLKGIMNEKYWRYFKKEKN